jgi:two-component system cell cycle sensor histidine kinase/response regulator CckA
VAPWTFAVADRAEGATPMSTGNSKPELEAERKLSSSIPACEPPFLPHEAEDKLRHSEAAQRELAERQKAILNALPAQIALIDAQGLIISVNENWRRFAQENAWHGSDCGVGQNYLSICDGSRGKSAEEAGDVAVGMRRVLSGELKEFALEYPCPAPNEPRWFRLIITPLHEDHPAGAVVTHLNITERKLAEDKVRASETRYRSLASATAQIVWTTEPDGKVSGALPEWQGFTGQSVDEIEGMGWTQALHPEDVKEAVKAWTEAVESCTTYVTEYRLRRHDGVYCDFAVRGVPVLSEEGTIREWVGCCMDITERKRASEQLAHHQALLRMASRVGRLGAWQADLPSLKLRWSDETAAVHDEPPGFSPPLSDAINYYTPEYREVIRQVFESCVNQGTPFDLEAQIVTAKGRLIWVRAIGEAVRDAGGRITQVQGAFQDINLQKQAEESNELFRALIEQSNDGIEVVDPHTGRYLDVNKKAWERLGYSREEMLSLSLPDIEVSAMNQDSMPTMMEDIRRSGSKIVVGRQRRKDGSTFPVEVNVQHIHLNRDYVVAVVRDITERQQAEEQIREQAAFLDKARDAIVARDLAGKILFWNKGAERMYGWLKQDVLGRNVREVLYSNPAKFAEVNALTISQGEWSGELQHLTQSKDEITIEARWTLIRDNQGLPKSILAINTDITDKKKLEAQFLRAQRMESVGTLAGGIAHDLNNILAPIVMSIDLLKLNAKDESKEILETIAVSAKRGADIVRQVLSFARGMEGQRVEIQLKHLLKDIEVIIKDTFPKDIRLQFSVPSDTWTILGDPTQMHQVLLNLSVNARDAMPNGGNLTIFVENAVLDEHYAALHREAKPGRYVKISVTDTGMGIPPKLVDKIFEPFFTTKVLTKGTGLGLSTVMAIVKSHEGIINVYSDLGKGTTFNVFLPAMEALSAGQAVSAGAVALPRGNGETVLVVDDETSILTITRSTLQAFGYRVLTANDGAEAVACYAQHGKEIAVVLTDMMMPVMAGPAAIHALMKMNPAIKIIAASGLHANGSGTKVAVPGVNHFLTKPYTTDALLNTLRTILEET